MTPTGKANELYEFYIRWIAKDINPPKEDVVAALCCCHKVCDEAIDSLDMLDTYRPEEMAMAKARWNEVKEALNKIQQS